MCGRFTLTSDDRTWLADAFGVPLADLDEISELVIPRFNIAPTQEHWIVTAAGEDRAARRASWGLVPDASRVREAARLINARSEDLERRPSYRDAFRERRCVVPADGFLEWLPGGTRVPRPYWFHRNDHGPLRFAGLYAEPVLVHGVPRPATFTILTTAAGADVAPIHDRMPVLLEDDAAVDGWLHAREPVDRLRALLRSTPAGTLARRAVSPRVNSVANDDPSCLTEVEAVTQVTLL